MAVDNYDQGCEHVEKNEEEMIARKVNDIFIIYILSSLTQAYVFTFFNAKKKTKNLKTSD